MLCLNNIGKGSNTEIRIFLDIEIAEVEKDAFAKMKIGVLDIPL